LEASIHEGRANILLGKLSNSGDVAVPLSPGFDELAFGTALDGWSRTYR
jgi:hypothetical protein